MKNLMVLSLAVAAMACASPARGSDYEFDQEVLNDKLDQLKIQADDQALLRMSAPPPAPIHQAPAKRWDEFTPAEHEAMGAPIVSEPPEPKPICSVGTTNDGVKVVACWGQAVKFIYPDGTVKDH